MIIAVFPIYWLFTVALTPPNKLSEIFIFPQGLNVGVFLQVFQQVAFGRYLFNSFVIAAGTTVIVLVVGSLAGYAFGKLQFRGRRVLLVLLLTISYFPGVTYLLPLFRLFSGNVEVFGIQSPTLLNTPWALIIPFSAFFLPFVIFVLATFYSQIPDGLVEASRIEGTTRLGALYRVVLPLSAPGVATAGMITFINVYNEFFFSFVFTNGSAENWSPMLWGIISFQRQYGADFHLMAAASLIAIVPVAVIIFYGQNRIIKGLTAGGIKG
jgi:multiple sugar transport system permease protein